MNPLKKSVYISNSFNPKENLGFEDYLMSICKKDEVIFYLWQNQKTVVIGQHQNPYKECNLVNLEQDGIHLVRRKSGGGAVFHDMGNLNFTFIAHPDNYDKNRHFQVILDGLKPWGINAEQTGRNDITVDGMKFSGNSFIIKRLIKLHHGTLLVDVNMQELGRYLTPPKIKLVAKGIDSVRSRVVNLKDLNPKLTIDELKKTLIEAFDSTYLGTLEKSLVPERKVYEEFCVPYENWQWTIGKSPQATMTHSKTFEWGNLVMDLHVVEGCIESCIVSSDTLEDQPIEDLQEHLKGVRLKLSDIENEINSLFSNEKIKNDIKEFLSEFIPS